MGEVIAVIVGKVPAAARPYHRRSPWTGERPIPVTLQVSGHTGKSLERAKGPHHPHLRDHSATRG